VDPARLEEAVTAIFVALGLPADDARVCADGVVRSDLRGHESHGVSNNVLGAYVPGLRNGTINPRPDIRIVRESLVLSRWDGDRGMGFVAGRRAMDWVIARAKEHGAAFAAVDNSRHIGMVQFYPLMALEHDLIGMAMTGGLNRAVVPFQGREPQYGTNPISIAIPTGEMPPFVLDMATTTVAGGKIVNAIRDARPIPPTYALGHDGRPTTDPTEAMAARRLLPLGATKEGSGHKGYGLALWVELFTGILSSHGFAPQSEGDESVNHFFGAWDPAAFLPLREFNALLEGRLREMTETPPAEGYERVLYAGLPEWEAEQDHLANGIPLHPKVIEDLGALAADLDVPFDMLR
jgi:LDH2 family malate/lactate/ureidoglycolate dehydrogenase